jgi:hypothetical protein
VAEPTRRSSGEAVASWTRPARAPHKVPKAAPKRGGADRSPPADHFGRDLFGYKR